MRIYTGETVLEAARKRVEFLYNEFENVYVAMSGGKDSTVCFQLALETAERLGRLPVRVVFVDQEAEWQAVIEYIRTVMHDPRVEPYWLQVPIKISNSASVDDFWLYCWDEAAEDIWMRPREPDSIHVNNFGTDRFKEMFDAFLKTMHPNEPAILIGGVRAEESPSRNRSLIQAPKYKGVTWAKHPDHSREHYTFFPIYDWSYSDVWKYIHERGEPYCRIYDLMYQHGVPIHKMRVSNLHHETAIHALFWLQEIEGDTWDKLTRRLGGVHVVRNIEYGDLFQAPKELPFMFRSWREYRDYLLDRLISNPEHQKMFRETFAHYDSRYDGMLNPDSLTKVQVATILTNDFHMTKLDNWSSQPFAKGVIQWKRGDKIPLKYAKWIPDHVVEAARLAGNTK